jgi:hypothetical protein
MADYTSVTQHRRQADGACPPVFSAVRTICHIFTYR